MVIAILMVIIWARSTKREPARGAIPTASHRKFQLQGLPHVGRRAGPEQIRGHAYRTASQCVDNMNYCIPGTPRQLANPWW